MENKKFVCVCCGYYTLESEDPLSYDICPVCFWEQDPIQQNNPNFTGGANTVSLNQAKKIIYYMEHVKRNILHMFGYL